MNYQYIKILWNGLKNAKRNIQHLILISLHRGQRYHCKLCGYSSRDMQEIGHSPQVLLSLDVVGAGLRKTKCWACGATERERLIYIYLRDYMHLFDSANKEILHIAPEPNLYKFLSTSKHNYICGDICVDNFPSSYNIKAVNILNLNIEDNRFDLIICNHVFEHIEEDCKAMKELYRVLKPGGIAVLQVPISMKLKNTYEDSSADTPEKRLAVFGQRDHVRIYGMDYTKRLSEAGFRVEIINIDVQKYSEYYINPKEALFICHKD